MSYNRYDEESYYRPTEKVYPESGSEYRPPPPRNNIPLILLVLIVGIVIGVFVVRGFPQVATSIPVGPTQATTPAPTSPPGNATCPSNADDYFSVPTHRVTAGNACAFVLDRGQTTIPVGWSIQWTPSPVDGYQHVAFVTASPLTIALNGATARKSSRGRVAFTNSSKSRRSALPITSQSYLKINNSRINNNNKPTFFYPSDIYTCLYI